MSRRGGPRAPSARSTLGPGRRVVEAPRWSRSQGERFARTHLAYVDREFVAAFDRESVRRTRVGVLVVLPAVASYVLSYDETTFAALLTPGVLALAALGESTWRIVRAGREFAVGPGRPGFARARQPRVLDYVGPLTLTIVCLQVLAGLVLAGAALTVVVRDGWSAPLAGAAVGGIVLAVLSAAAPLAWRVVVRRPQRAVDPAHLYLQDAWRAEALRTTGILPVIAPVALLRTSASDVMPGAAFPLVAVLTIGITIVALGDHPSPNRFRARLWPTLAPGQVLMPGDAVPEAPVSPDPGWAGRPPAADAARGAAARPPAGTPGTARPLPGASRAGGRSSGPWQP